MGGNIISFDRLLNVRHVAGDALTPRAVFRVMGMLRDGAFEACRILFRVALKTKSVPLRDQVGLVLITVNLVTIEATQVAVVHVALHEIIALHSVLVRRQVGILIEIRRSRLQFLEPPMIRQTLTRQKANRPVVIFPVDGVTEGPTLAVALDAHVISSNVFEHFRIHDVRPRRMSDVLASGAMALLAANIPFRHFLTKSPRTASGCSLGSRTTFAMRVRFQPLNCCT